jgi:hypothetical protein
VATLTPLDKVVSDEGFEYFKAFGIYPKGSSPKSTRRFLLNCRLSLWATPELLLLASVTCEKNARRFAVLLTDLVTS